MQRGRKTLERLASVLAAVGLVGVMLTAAADDANAWQAWTGGVDYFLAKPFDASELLRYLDYLFSAGVRAVPTA